jgi:aldehyde oxidoreductase
MKRVTLEINGLTRQVVTDEDKVLLDLLRQDLRLTGAKQSCDRKGQCGACTVIVDGKAALSCLTKVKNLDGAKIITAEGLGTPDNPHLIQQAFVLSGAIQCGFCTPGMIMATKALLDKNLNPTKEEIKKALRRNICRCTGYVKIIEAVQLAAKFLRGEATPEEYTPAADAPAMGTSHPRRSSIHKACGTAYFTADVQIPGALELAVLRSTVPHAEIVKLETSAAEAMPGVAGVVTAKDIKGTNILKYIEADRPVLCRYKVHYIGDPVCIVAAETKAQAEAAVKKIVLELKELPVLDDPYQAMDEDSLRVHPERKNLCYEQPQIKGDADKALEESAASIEATFKTQTNHQAPLEPESTVAYFEEDEEAEQPKLVIMGRSINIHYHMAMLQEAVAWENMAYIEAYSGGQFGIRIDVISEGIAAAAAVHFQRAVRYIPSLTESMLMASKRHAFNMKVKLCADKNGRITAYHNDFVVDNGAYYSIGHVVIYRALLMLSGSYNIPNVKARARLVYTNNPWGSAARGAGAPQANFALECAVDMLAAEMGIDPFEFRIMNSLKPGETKSTGQAVTEWPFPELMEKMRPHYERAVAEAKAKSTASVLRGVGIGTGAFGIGGPNDASVVAVELGADGDLSIFAAAADPGEGNESMLLQLSGAFMNMPLGKIHIHTRSTENTAASGPAAGSRITYMIGGALINGLEQLKAAPDKLIYLDPDIAVFNSMEPLLNILDEYPVVLTPHQILPEKTLDAIIDNEVRSLKYGIFNLGFFAVSNEGQGIDFINWWTDRLKCLCYDDRPKGLFVDQKWCDHAPVFFDKLHILRDPGYNVATWNLAHRKVEMSASGEVLVNGDPLKFYHFTGYDSGAGAVMLSKYSKSGDIVNELWDWYRRQLTVNGHELLTKEPWAYGHFDNGEKIEDDMRMLYRDRKDLQNYFMNPYSTQRDDGGYLAWWINNYKQ